MFGNLKNKVGDVADLKKYASPHALLSLAGSRQRSSQHTPGVQSPPISLSRHSRQDSNASLSSLQNVPLSPTSNSADNGYEGSLSTLEEKVKITYTFELVFMYFKLN